MCVCASIASQMEMNPRTHVPSPTKCKDSSVMCQSRWPVAEWGQVYTYMNIRKIHAFIYIYIYSRRRRRRRRRNRSRRENLAWSHQIHVDSCRHNGFSLLTGPSWMRWHRRLPCPSSLASSVPASVCWISCPTHCAQGMDMFWDSRTAKFEENVMFKRYSMIFHLNLKLGWSTGPWFLVRNHNYPCQPVRDLWLPDSRRVPALATVLSPTMATVVLVLQLVT